MDEQASPGQNVSDKLSEFNYHFHKIANSSIRVVLKEKRIKPLKFFQRLISNKQKNM